MDFGLQNYRESYNIFASNGILLIMNLQSGETFVTRKITRAISKMALGIQDAFSREFRFSKRLGAC